MTKPLEARPGETYLQAYSRAWGEMATFALAWRAKARAHLQEVLGNTRPCAAGWVCAYLEDHTGGFYFFPETEDPEYAGKHGQCPHYKDADCPRRVAVIKWQLEQRIARETERLKELEEEARKPGRSRRKASSEFTES